MKISRHFNTWWTKPTDEVPGSVFSVASSMNNDSKAQELRFRSFLSIYDARAYSSLSYDGYYLRSDEYERHDLVYNVSKSIVDTIVARVTKNRPRPVFVTQDATWSEQRRAKLLTKFIDGQFDSLKIYELGYLGFRDAAIFGTGLIKFQASEGRIEATRVLPNEIVVSHAETQKGNPRQLHHRFRVATEVLVSLFPKKANEIILSNGSTEDDEVSSGMVEVIESWHLSSSNGDDGRHTICTEKVCLLDEDYNLSWFPFAIVHFERPVMGFWGRGLIENMRVAQRNLDEQVKIIAENIRMTGRVGLIVRKGATISDVELARNLNAVVITTDDVNQDVKPFDFGRQSEVSVAQRDEIFDKMFRLSGVSELSSQGLRPAGVDSAVAMREFNDIESDRFAPQFQQYESFILDISRILIGLSREQAMLGHDVESKSASRKFFKSIKWSDVDLEDSKYVMSLFSSSVLPRHPAARMQTLQELMKDGLIDKDEFLRQMDVKDLEQFTDQKTARLDDIYSTLDRMLDGGGYEAPDEFLGVNGLKQGIEIFKNAFMQHRNEAPDDVLTNIRSWVDDANEIIMALEPPMPMEGQPTGSPEGM